MQPAREAAQLDLSRTELLARQAQHVDRPVTPSSRRWPP